MTIFALYLTKKTFQNFWALFREWQNKGEAFDLPSFVIQLKYGFCEILQVLWCIPVDVQQNSQN